MSGNGLTGSLLAIARDAVKNSPALVLVLLLVGGFFWLERENARTFALALDRQGDRFSAALDRHSDHFTASLSTVADRMEKLGEALDRNGLLTSGALSRILEAVHAAESADEDGGRPRKRGG